MERDGEALHAGDVRRAAVSSGAPMTYRPGWCTLCGYQVGGLGLLCNQCYRGREDLTLPHYMKERHETRLQRLAHYERTGQPWPHHVHRLRAYSR